jgi:hypothetical protein
MAAITINQLPSASSLLPDDILLASSGSVTSQVTVANLKPNIISGSDFISSYGGALQSTNITMFSGSTSLTSSKVIQLVSLSEEFINTRYNITASVNIGSLNGINTFYGNMIYEGPVIVSGSITSSGNISTPGLTSFGSTGSISNIFLGLKNERYTTSYNNTAVGGSSLLYTVTGSNNTGIGAYSCWYINGSGNTGVGSVTIIGFNNYNPQTVTNADNNTAIGFEALYRNTTGSYNTAIGSYALDYLTTGNNNIAIGKFAGRYSTGPNYSILIGSDSMISNNNTQNIIIITTPDFRTFDGGSNSITIGPSTNLFGMVSIKGLVIDNPLGSPPTIPTDPGTTGTVLVDSNYIYVCIATNSWKRTALGSTF